MKSHHYVNWPLENGGGLLCAQMTGSWTKSDLQKLRTCIDHLMQAADICALPDAAPSETDLPNSEN